MTTTNQDRLASAKIHLDSMRADLKGVTYPADVTGSRTTLADVLRYHMDTFERVIAMAMITCADAVPVPTCRRCGKTMDDHVVFHDHQPHSKLGFIAADFGPDVPTSGIYCKLPLI